MSAHEKITVRETIHHGNYRNVREQRIAPTWAGFIELLAASPYNNGGGTSDLSELWNLHRAHNRYVARLFADLLTRGIGDLGWAHYEVVSAKND